MASRKAASKTARSFIAGRLGGSARIVAQFSTAPISKTPQARGRGVLWGAYFRL